MGSTEGLRNVMFQGKPIAYTLARKDVKNLNLRVRNDGSVTVSANETHEAEQVDAFVIAKGAYITGAQAQFRLHEAFTPAARQYVSGETFVIQGRSLRLKVIEGRTPSVTSDGVYLYLQVPDKTDVAKKERVINRYLQHQCNAVFGEIIVQVYPVFAKYGVAMPTLRVRNMNTRWGSCLAQKGVITLNKQLLQAPRHCIEYVVMHEFCHFKHQNHSKEFYSLLSTLMPDWRERKQVLEQQGQYYC